MSKHYPAPSCDRGNDEDAEADDKDLYKECRRRHERWLSAIFTNDRQSVLLSLFAIQHGRRQQLVLAFSDSHQPEAVFCGAAVLAECAVEATVATFVWIGHDDVGDESVFRN